MKKKICFCLNNDDVTDWKRMTLNKDITKAWRTPYYYFSVYQTNMTPAIVCYCFNINQIIIRC